MTSRDDHLIALIKTSGQSIFKKKGVFEGTFPAGILFYYPIIIEGHQRMSGFESTRMLKFRKPILAGHAIMIDSIQKQSVCPGRLFYGE